MRYVIALLIDERGLVKRRATAFLYSLYICRTSRGSFYFHTIIINKPSLLASAMTAAPVS
jgi:hypothetical protein